MLGGGYLLLTRGFSCSSKRGFLAGVVRWRCAHFLGNIVPLSWPVWPKCKTFRKLGVLAFYYFFFPAALTSKFASDWREPRVLRLLQLARCCSERRLASSASARVGTKGRSWCAGSTDMGKWVACIEVTLLHYILQDLVGIK